MSHLQYYSYPGYGQELSDRSRYSQAVRIGDKIEISGQGGWDPKTGEISDDVNTQIDQAFANVDVTLRDAGGQGWSQVYRIKSFHIPLNDEVVEALERNLKKWTPEHRPVLTCVGVTTLGLESMKVEIEVVAHDPEVSK